jgi:uncharacterized delta-60 repeat protein
MRKPMIETGVREYLTGAIIGVRDLGISVLNHAGCQHKDLESGKEKVKMRGKAMLVFGCVGFLVLLSSSLLAQRERWVYRYNGPGNGGDGARSIVTGLDGNLYAAGRSQGSGTGYDFVVISLTASGAERWIYRYSGPVNSPDAAVSIAVGPDSNIYAAGYIWGDGSCYDFTVISLTPSGEQRWIYQLDGPAGGSDCANSIVTGPKGNVYVAGYSCGSGTSEDFTVVSLDPSGGERWVYRYDGPGGYSFDEANSIVMGSDGNLYAAGQSGPEHQAHHRDFTIMSLTESGAERWIYLYNGPADSTDAARAIVMGSDGNLYAGGMSQGLGTLWDFTVVSVTSSGEERWVYRYTDIGYFWGEASAITMGSDGNVYVAGWTTRFETVSEDFTVVSLDPLGGERWIYRYDGPDSYSDEANSIVMGSDGNLYAAGWSHGSGTDRDFTVLSLDIKGAERWVYRYDGPGNYDDRAYSIVTGPDGNLYAAGYSSGSGTGIDLTVISLVPDTLEPSGGLVTGGGWIPGDGSRKRNFGFNAHSEDGRVWGQLQFNDHETKMKVHSEGIDDLTVYGDTAARFSGLCRVDKAGGYTFTCMVEDRGEPGRGRDRFSIEIWDPDGNPFYSADDLLGGGNIQIHAGSVYGDDHTRRPDGPLGNVTEQIRSSEPYPNPFSESTRLAYLVVKPEEVSLEIFDLTGKLVRRLVDVVQIPGQHFVEWDGTDSSGRKVSTGIYIYLLTAGEAHQAGKLVMVR